MNEEQKSKFWTAVFVAIIVIPVIIGIMMLSSSCSRTVPPQEVMVTLNAGVGGGQVDTPEPSKTPEPTGTNTPIPPTPTITPWVPPTPQYDPATQYPYGLPLLLNPVLRAWEDDIKVYVLLGSDYASWRRNLATGTDNTDAFIIVILRTDPPGISLISVPRDLYVNLPGYGMSRINTAYRFGDLTMLEDTVRYNFGLPVDGVAYVRMEAFIRFIDDALHGIEVEVRTPLLDRCTDIYFNILPGTHFMDGKTALCYARVRKFNGGFSREERQRDVLLAIKNDILETAEERPVLFALSLIDDYMNEHRYTTINPFELIELAPAMYDAKDNIVEYQMGYDIGLTKLIHPESGAWLLVPPPPECMSDLIWMAVMGESWDTIDSSYLENVCGVEP